MNNNKQNQLATVIYKLGISAVVGLLAGLVFYGIFHVYYPELSQWSFLIGLGAFASLLAFMDLNGEIR